jgi:hypothetical protein
MKSVQFLEFCKTGLRSRKLDGWLGWGRLRTNDQIFIILDFCRKLNLKLDNNFIYKRKIQLKSFK